jgi:NADH-quinone oxidoreductase subunit B
LGLVETSSSLFSFIKEDTIIMSDINLVEAPAGVEGSGFFATSLEKVIGMARANSLWPLPFATSCCGIEFMAL